MIKGEPILILVVDDDPAHSEVFRRLSLDFGMKTEAWVSETPRAMMIKRGAR